MAEQDVREQREQRAGDGEREGVRGSGDESGERGGSGSGGLARRGDGSLSDERGRTSIADGVVTKVAGLAAGEVAGVYELGGAAARTVGAVGQRVGIGDSRTQGVSVEVGDREAAVDLTVVVEYGESIPRVADEVRQQIIKRVEGITGLSVVEVNIDVDDLHFPGEDDEDQESARVA